MLDCRHEIGLFLQENLTLTFPGAGTHGRPRHGELGLAEYLLRSISMLDYRHEIDLFSQDILTLMLRGAGTMHLIDAGLGLELRNRLREALAAHGLSPPDDDAGTYSDLFISQENDL